MMVLKKAILISCSTAAFACSSAAWAQAPAGQAAAGPATTVDPAINSAIVPQDTAATVGDIIVTAQKREERIQKTPIAITALTPEINSRAGVRDFSDIQKVAPDVSIFSNTGATSIAIRGVRQTALGPTNDTTTATNVDGVYLARPTGLSGYFYDIQRIEVLKGPQGTLYGRNATGGAVNIITNKPTDVLGMRGEFEGGNYQLYRAEAAVNLPVTDGVALRFAGRVFGRHGYYSNGQGNENQKSARVEGLFKFTPRAKLLLTADYELSDARQPGIALLEARNRFASPPGPPGPSQPLAPLPVAIPANPFTVSPIIYPYGPTTRNQLRSEVYGFNGQFDYDLDFATLTAQVGHRHVGLTSFGPADGGTIVPAPLVAPVPAPPGPPVATYGYTQSPQRSTSTTAELRLASSGTHPLQYVIGAYHFDEDFGGQLCQIATLGGTGPCTFLVDNPVNLTKSYAFFGQATYTPEILNNALHLTGGIRFNHDHKTADTLLSLGGVIKSNIKGIQATYEKVTYRAAAAFDITPQNLLYGSFSTGFRAGGFAYGSTPTYKPETINAYEIGSKNRFFNNRVQLNLEGWIYDYTNVEQNVVTAATPPAVGLADLSVQSIGSVKYKGASAQALFAVTRHDHLEGFVQYLDAHYGTFVIPPNFVNTPPLTLGAAPNGSTPGVYSGNQVANTPKWSGNAAYSHDFDVADGVLDFRAAMQFSSAREFGTYAPGTLQYDSQLFPGYQRVDLSVRYAPNGGHWNVTAYVNNVGDEKTVQQATYELIGRGSGLVVGSLFPPRTFGAIFGFNF